MSYGTRKRRHELTLGDKMEVIRMIDNRKSQTDVAKVYNCSQSQISRIVSKREDILAEWAICDDPEQKKSRFSRGLLKRESSRSVKDEAAPTVADQSTSPRPPSEAFDGNEQTSETPNNGLLEYWKNHSSTYGRRSFGDFDPEYAPWGRQSGSGAKRGPKGRPKPSSNKESRISNQMLDILKNYDVCDVYCADELALHYDAMPNLDVSDDDEGDAEGNEGDRKDGETSSNQKQITVLLTCNVTGSDKRDFLVIEDSERSDSDASANRIEGCQRAKAPYAWMTSDVFKEYLTALDYDMRKQRRYILLLVDNAAAHDYEAGKNLEHVRVLYMRSYTTPFFHGIFYSVRAHYRKQILLKLVANNPELMAREDGRGRRKQERSSLSLSVDIDLEEAVNMLKLAWKSVSAQDVVQCFSKSGLCAPHIHGLPESEGDDLPELPEGFVTDEQYEDFVNMDVDAECTASPNLTSVECRILSDLREQGFLDVGLEPAEDIPDGVHVNSSSNASGSSGKLDVGAFRGEKRTVSDSSGEVERSLSTLRSFLEQRGLHLHNLHALEAQIYSCHSGGH